jgi:hypothetical protein
VSGKIPGELFYVEDVGVSHSCTDPGERDAVADRVSEKTEPDALGRGMGSRGNPSRGNDTHNLLIRRFSVLWPNAFLITHDSQPI